MLDRDFDIPIKDIQKIQLEILVEFDRICRKHDIKYQLAYGTLLGAVRHKGFIPWDDDVDVCMLRDDYNKFLEVCEAELDPDFFLQNYETDEKYNLHFTKIRKNNTLFVETIFAKCEMHHGIFIDIFPMDNVLPGTIAGRAQCGILRVIDRLNMSRQKKRSLENEGIAKKCLRFILHYIARIIPKPQADKLQTKIACMFQNKDTLYVSYIANGVSREKMLAFLVERDSFYDTIDGDFEGHTFPIPRNYDDVLSGIYGDYMTPPPIGERIPHHDITEISLDTTKGI